MKNKMIGLIIMLISIVQVLISLTSLILQYNSGAITFSFGLFLLNLFSVFAIPALFFFIGWFIMNNKK